MVYNGSMKTIAGFLFAAILFFATDGLAADLFVRQPTQQDSAIKPFVPSKPSQTPPKAQPSPIQKTQPSVPQASTKSPPNMNDYIIRYYKSCLSKETPSLNGANLKSLCGCTAQKISESLTIDDIQKMGANTPEGAAKRNIMLVKVYAPCLEYPTRAKIITDCFNGIKAQPGLISNPDSVCLCMGDNMAKFVAQRGPEAIAKNLAANPGDLNPLASLMSSNEFIAETRNAMGTCLTAK